MPNKLPTVKDNHANMPRVLCVDDEPLNIFLLEAILSPCGYEVVPAINGAEALQKIRTEHIDICLLDLMMPGLDGFEVCRLIKSEEERNNIPVVMVTAYGDVDNRIRGIEAGAEDYITKPFNGAEVLARIKMLLHVKSLHDRRAQEAKIAAESASKAKRQFLGNMSHEFRTPMNGVLGMTQLLEMTKLTGEQQEYIKDLTQSGENLKALIDDVLEFSRVEAGQIGVQMSEFSLQQCINDIVTMQKNITNEKGLTIDVVFVGVPCVLTGDMLLVRQILLKLLENAVKFTEDGGINILVQALDCYENTVIVQIAVSDTGIGISAEALDKIFLPFIQEDGSFSRKYDGAGLGLSISRQLAELLGGSIAVTSSKNAGSCFTVNLPFSVIREIQVD